MRRPLTGLTVTVLLLGACGGNGDQPPERAISVDPGGLVRVEAHEYRFDPNRIVVRAPAPRRTRSVVQLELANRGSLPHDLRVLSGSRELGGTRTVGRDRRATAVLTLAPGRYRFICTVGDHARLGMRGSLLVG